MNPGCPAHWVWRPELRAIPVPSPPRAATAGSGSARHALVRGAARPFKHAPGNGRTRRRPRATASPERPGRPGYRVDLEEFSAFPLGASVGRLSTPSRTRRRGGNHVGRRNQRRTSRLRQRRPTRGGLSAGAAPTEAGFRTFNWRTILARNSIVGVRYDSAPYLANRAVRCPMVPA